jgi:hypothetical protein
MCFRGLVGVFFVLCFSIGWGVEKQRVGIAAFVDLSPEADEVISTILQNSLATVLQKEKRFELVLVSNTVTNLAHARERGTNAKLDVIIYGSYRREGREFVALVQIYDILENELKMSRLYRGEYSRNIFDTVDTIAASASEEIKRTLPALVTEEDILRAQTRRKEIYEPAEVTLRREMRLGFGVMYTTADWLYSQSIWNHRWEGGEQTIVPCLSLSMRLDVFRFTLEKMSLPWVPTWYKTQGTGLWPIEDSTNTSAEREGLVIDTEMRGAFLLYGDGFWGTPGRFQGFLSIGGYGISSIPFPEQNEGLSVGGMLLGGGIFAKNWELSVLYQVWPLSQGWRGTLDPDLWEYETSSTNLYQYNFPFVSVRGSYFFTSSFGVTAKLSFLDAQKIHIWYDEGTAKEGRTVIRSTMTDIALEMVYRFQFGF